jgi:hypothetical protein
MATRALALGDLNGDGKLDLVVGNNNEANLVFLNNGTASPFNAVTGAALPGTTTPTTALALADVNGDGELDLLVGNNGQRNRLYLNNGTPTGTTQPFAGVTPLDLDTQSYSTTAHRCGRRERRRPIRT